MPKTYTYRELEKVLRNHDRRFEFYMNRGKGSERMIYHPDIDGRSESYPVKHHGRNTEIKAGTLAAIKRRFNLKGVL